MEHIDRSPVFGDGLKEAVGRTWYKSSESKDGIYGVVCAAKALSKNDVPGLWIGALLDDLNIVGEHSSTALKEHRAFCSISLQSGGCLTVLSALSRFLGVCRDFVFIDSNDEALMLTGYYPDNGSGGLDDAFKIWESIRDGEYTDRPEGEFTRCISVFRSSQIDLKFDKKIRRSSLKFSLRFEVNSFDQPEL